MTDIRCSIPDDFMRDLKRALGVHTSTDVVQEAMTIAARGHARLAGGIPVL